jgi:hypothetical protein
LFSIHHTGGRKLARPHVEHRDAGVARMLVCRYHEWLQLVSLLQAIDEEPE